MSINNTTKIILKYSAYILATVILLALIFLQSTPSVSAQKSITPQEMKLARDSIKNVMDQLASYRTFVEFTFSENDLYAISKLATHLVPNTRAVITTSQFGVSVSASTKLSFITDFYLNSTCLLANNGTQAVFEECQLGNLPLPNTLVNWLLEHLVYLAMGEEVSNTFNQLVASTEHSNVELTLKAKKDKFFRNEVNESIKQVGDIAAFYTQSANVSPEHVQLYVDEITLIQSKNMSDYISALFHLAQKRTAIEGNTVDENTAIIWAFAVVFGDYRFASLIGLEKDETTPQVPLLRGREDLTKHFIYSAALQQLGDIKIGLSIGEAKELLDSISSGTGLSFADIAADKAGLKFAKFITSSNANAEYAQNHLKSITNESAFFPFVHDLPEGFTGSNFKRVITSTDSKNYLIIEKEIDKRINQRSLFKGQKPLTSINETWSKPASDNFKMWFKADTHIHTKFSDGKATVDEIAKQASSFGCDAIAITDHGDHNLASVASSEYFEAINKAKATSPYLTIMPGIEWNIPPMNGREHATLILPDTTNAQRNLAAFRARYDHFERFDEKVLSPKKAFNWLKKHGADNSTIKPLIIYNHPSRKDWQSKENAHDFTYWRNFTDLIVGFSGAPGHQKKRSTDNGSYEFHLKAINGWDPSVANIGGEWDRLLQQGYKIWAARAGSDFHNTKMDYWPCQFSSTHVLARSRKHNDILAAYQAGATWAQHGNFINSINFNVNSNSVPLNIGQEGKARRGKEVSINLTVKLNQFDWQNNQTSLDLLELIIITENKIETIKFTADKLQETPITFNYPYTLNSKFAIFRWRGTSFQPEEHDYLFYTNPIKLNSLK